MLLHNHSQTSIITPIPGADGLSPYLQDLEQFVLELYLKSNNSRETNIIHLSINNCIMCICNKNQDALPNWSGLTKALFSFSHPLASVALTIFIIFRKDTTSDKILPIVITLHVIEMLHLLINNFIN